MPAVVPHPFLFHFSFEVPKLAKLPKKGKWLLNLPASCLLPRPGELDELPSFGQLQLAWSEGGLAITTTVSGKQEPLHCNSRDPLASDGLQVWIDTRNTQNIHRASKFCHHFCLLPEGKGQSRKSPYAEQLPIARAREESVIANSELLLIKSQIKDDGYILEAWLPAQALHGFDPDASPRLGFYSLIRDSELGDQPLTVGAEFPFDSDPSLWSTLELVEE